MDLLSPAVNGKRYSCQKLNKIYSSINTNNKRYGNKTIMFFKRYSGSNSKDTAYPLPHCSLHRDSPSILPARSSTPEEETG